MREFIYVLRDSAGIHAHPAEVVVKEASKYRSDITIMSKGKCADAKKIFSVMSLTAKNGDAVRVSIFGEDEGIAETELKRVFEKNL